MIDIKNKFPGSGWFGIDYEKERWEWFKYIREGWSTDKNGDSTRVYNDVPFKITIEVDGKKLCTLKKDMNDIKAHDREGIFKCRVVDGYADINNALMEILEKFGYEDIRMKKFEEGGVTKGDDFLKYRG